MRCRICNRAPHPGEPCLEDLENPGESQQYARLLEQANAAAQQPEAEAPVDGGEPVDLN